MVGAGPASLTVAMHLCRGNRGGNIDSWIIGTAINTRAGKSEVWAFDASNVEDGPVAVWQADYSWPLGFHGTWAKA